MEGVWKALLVTDHILIRLAALPDQATFMNLERRLFQSAGKSFLTRARAAVTAARGALGSAATKPTKADSKRVQSAIAGAFDGWADDVRPALRAVVQEAYRGAKTILWAKAMGKIKRPLAFDRSRLVLKAGRRAVQIRPTFDNEDQRAMDALARQQMIWIGRHYADNLSERVRGLVEDNMLAQGLGRDEAGAALERALRAEFGVTDAEGVAGYGLPDGWRGSTSLYMEGLAAHTVTVGRALGSVAALTDVGATTYTYVNPEDERTCELCDEQDGKTFSVEAADKKLNDELAAENPEGVKEAHPWADDVQEIKDAPDDFAIPPLHFLCRCGIDISEEEVANIEAQPEGSLSEEEQTSTLMHGDVVDDVQLGGGMNQSRLLTLLDEKAGVSLNAVFKSAVGEAEGLRRNIEAGTYWRREIAASRVAKAFGVDDLVPTTVERTIKGEIGSLQAFAKGATPYDDVAEISRVQLERSAAERMRVFDYATGNSDRHEGNVLLRLGPPDKLGYRQATPVLIDNGLAFPKGAAERLIQPWLIADSDLLAGPLLDSTTKLIASIDPYDVAVKLAESGIEKSAIEQVLLRLKALQKDPSMLEFDRYQLYERLKDAAQYTTYIDKLSREDFREIGQIVERAMKGTDFE